MSFRLPEDKLSRMEGMLSECHGRRSGTRRDLESLAGTLQHAAVVIRDGRLFIRRIYDLLSSTRHFKPQHFVRLNAECSADIEWWVTFVRQWNGVSLYRKLGAVRPDVILHSDASGSWGCGAFWGPLWLQVPWSGFAIARQGIVAELFIELFPIVLAAIVWGLEWRGCAVECHCDNMAVVQTINVRSARDVTLCNLLRCLFFISARHDFSFVARHTRGVDNVAADALSRGNSLMFLTQIPSAASQPTVLPLELLRGFSQRRPTWTVHDWTVWFDSCCSSQ